MSAEQEEFAIGLIRTDEAVGLQVAAAAGQHQKTSSKLSRMVESVIGTLQRTEAKVGGFGDDSTKRCGRVLMLHCKGM